MDEKPRGRRRCTGLNPIGKLHQFTDLRTLQTTFRQQSQTTVKGHLTFFQPNLVFIQYDPMKFISNYREFSIESAPYFEEWMKHNQKGIFNQHDY